MRDDLDHDLSELCKISVRDVIGVGSRGVASRKGGGGGVVIYKEKAISHRPSNPPHVKPTSPCECIMLLTTMSVNISAFYKLIL